MVYEAKIKNLMYIYIVYYIHTYTYFIILYTWVGARRSRERAIYPTNGASRQMYDIL